MAVGAEALGRPGAQESMSSRLHFEVEPPPMVFEAPPPAVAAQVAAEESVTSPNSKDGPAMTRTTSQNSKNSRMSRTGTLAAQRQTPEEQVSQLLQLVGQTHQRVESALQLDNHEIDGHLAHAASLHNGLMVERNARELLASKSSEAMRHVHGGISQGLSDARQERHRGMRELEMLGDKGLAELSGMMAEEASTQEESKRYAQEIQAEVGNLYRTIHQEKGHRLEKGQKLGEAVKQKLTEVEDALSAERRFRIDSQNTLLELFGQMGEKMEQEMEACRRERLASTNRILSVIETVLPRVEAARHSQADNMTERVEDSGDAADIARAVASNKSARKGDIAKRKSMLFKGRLVNG